MFLNDREKRERKRWAQISKKLKQQNVRRFLRGKWKVFVECQPGFINNKHLKISCLARDEIPGSLNINIFYSRKLIFKRVFQISWKIVGWKLLKLIFFDFFFNFLFVFLLFCFLAKLNMSKFSLHVVGFSNKFIYYLSNCGSSLNLWHTHSLF